MSNDPILSLIGNTPVVRIQSLDTGLCELYVKLESQNPGGSIKDRIALSMIEAAEHSGALRPGGTIIEATAGNTGLGLALVAIRKGYKIKLVVPDKMSTEKIQQLKAMGVEVVLTRSDVNKGHPLYYQDYARRIADTTPGAYYIDQFNNPANPLAHATGTGPEIWEQMQHDLDAIVVGVGSSGTLSGLSSYFSSTAPALDFVLADPQGSILADYIETGSYGAAGSWRVEGIGEDFIPPLADFSRVKAAYRISDQESLFTARALLEKEGLLAGSSSGTLVAAALRYCRAQTRPQRVLTFICDSGNKYLSKQFNDNWLMDQGLVRQEQRADLSDLITRPHHHGATIFARQEDTLADAYQKLRRHDISQLPVIEGDAQLIGIVDEWDILSAIRQDKKNFSAPVRSVMSTDLLTLHPQDSLDQVLNIFRDNKVAPLVDGEHFLGLITQADVINYWQRH
jgi:cystathionine beta-synthase